MSENGDIQTNQEHCVSNCFEKKTMTGSRRRERVPARAAPVRFAAVRAQGELTAGGRTQVRRNIELGSKTSISSTVVRGNLFCGRCIV